MKIIYNDDIINSSLKLFIISSSYEKICPYLCKNNKDYEMIFLKEKINNFLNLEKKL